MKVAQLYPTICDSTDYTVHGILQTSTLEWVAFPISRGSSQPRDQTQVSCIAGRFFTNWATREAQEYWSGQTSPADLLYSPWNSPGQYTGEGRGKDWVVFPFSSGSSWPRNQTRASCIEGGFFTNWANMKETGIVFQGRAELHKWTELGLPVIREGQGRRQEKYGKRGHRFVRDLFLSKFWVVFFKQLWTTFTYLSTIYWCLFKHKLW